MRVQYPKGAYGLLLQTESMQYVIDRWWRFKVRNDRFKIRHNVLTTRSWNGAFNFGKQTLLMNPFYMTVGWMIS